MFRIFNTIGKEKITRIKSIPPGFILNLTVDETDYIIAEVLKRAENRIILRHIYCASKILVSENFGNSLLFKSYNIFFSLKYIK